METIGITVGLCGLATLFVWYCIACCRGFANSDYRRYYYARKGYRFFLEKGWSYERFVEKYTDRRDRFGWFLSVDSKERKCYERDQFNAMLVEAPELVAKFFSKEQQRFRFRKEFHQMRDEWMKIKPKKLAAEDNFFPFLDDSPLTLNPIVSIISDEPQERPVELIAQFDECEKAPQLPQSTPNSNKTQQLTFSELITISDVSTKDQVLANITAVIRTHSIGRNLALLIKGLKSQGYIPEGIGTRLLMKSMAIHYPYVSFGTPSGVRKYLNINDKDSRTLKEVANIETIINQNIQV